MARKMFIKGTKEEIDVTIPAVTSTKAVVFVETYASIPKVYIQTSRKVGGANNPNDARTVDVANITQLGCDLVAIPGSHPEAVLVELSIV